MKTWRSCRRRYHNKFVLGIFPKRIKRPLMFGSIVHEMLEANFEGKDPFAVLAAINLDHRPMFAKEREMYGAIIEDLRDIMDDYFDHYDGTVKPIAGPDGRRSEHEFRIRLDDGLYFTGKIDAVVRAKAMNWLEEHKTFSRMPSEDDRWRSVQGASYIRALEIMGGWPSIDGTLWDYVRSKPPEVPKNQLQNGSWSLAKLDTLPMRLERWLHDQRLRQAEYQKLMDEAYENRRSYFIRLYTPLRPRVVDNIWNDFVDTAHEIQEQHGKKKDQNIGWECKNCDYQALCKAEVHDTDTSYVLKTQYTTEERKSLVSDKDRDGD